MLYSMSIRKWGTRGNNCVSRGSCYTLLTHYFADENPRTLPVALPPALFWLGTGFVETRGVLLMPRPIFADKPNGLAVAGGSGMFHPVSHHRVEGGQLLLLPPTLSILLWLYTLVPPHRNSRFQLAICHSPRSPSALTCR